MDLTAEFYLQTIESVFVRHLLPKDMLTHRGRRVDLGAIRRPGLMTIEGENDDITGVGQCARRRLFALPSRGPTRSTSSAPRSATTAFSTARASAARSPRALPASYAGSMTRHRVGVVEQMPRSDWQRACRCRGPRRGGVHVRACLTRSAIAGREPSADPVVAASQLAARVRPTGSQPLRRGLPRAGPTTVWGTSRPTSRRAAASSRARRAPSPAPAAARRGPARAPGLGPLTARQLLQNCRSARPSGPLLLALVATCTAICASTSRGCSSAVARACSVSMRLVWAVGLALVGALSWSASCSLRREIEQLRRDRRLAEPDLLDVDAGLASLALDGCLDRLLDRLAVLDQVEHAGRPAYPSSCRPRRAPELEPATLRTIERIAGVRMRSSISWMPPTAPTTIGAFSG